MSSWTTPVLLVFFLSLTNACMRVNPVDPGIPAVSPCKMCDPIKVLTKGEVPEAVQVDYKDLIVTPDETGTCSKITFVCTGRGAGITIDEGGAIPDENTGMVTIVATCKTDGSGWQFNYMNTNFSVSSVYCTTV